MSGVAISKGQAQPQNPGPAPLDKLVGPLPRAGALVAVHGGHYSRLCVVDFPSAWSLSLGGHGTIPGSPLPLPGWAPSQQAWFNPGQMRASRGASGVMVPDLKG